MRKLIPVISLLFLITSCKIFAPSQMLRTGRDFKYSDFTQEQGVQEYKLAPFDKITFHLSTNNGENLINPISSAGSTTGTSNIGTTIGGGSGAAYTIEYDGTVKLPVFGRVKLSGYSIREAEKLLEDMYSKYYNNPFVQIEVSNMRVIVFGKGTTSGSASVITLANPNTTLFEALASAGGIEGGKAYNIKLIRGDLKNPQVFLIDLSTLDGMKKANLILQANDIIIIKPKNNYTEKFLTVITPYLTLVSMILLIFNTVKK
ncbi:MAG: polysaccharide biosynthesis/export family protein [Bacteroidales bacterium]